MFKTGIVLHYISEYSILEKDKAFILLSEEISKNKEIQPTLKTNTLDSFCNNLPIGTIICKNLTASEDIIVVCFPVFSSHLSLPVKPGEKIWYFEDTENTFKDEEIESNSILGVKNFWISRKIGSKISEDLNFTHIQRDSLLSDIDLNKIENIALEMYPGDDVESKKSRKKFIKEQSNLVLIPDIKNKKIYSERYKNILPDISSIYNDEKLLNLSNTAVPRWYSKPYEFTLQGSNNNILNLTKNNNTKISNRGAVDLIAGRHLLNEYFDKSEEDFLSIDLNQKTIKNLSKSESEKYIQNISKDGILKLDITNPVLKIKNTEGIEEVLKNQEYYLKQKLSDDNIQSLEGFRDFLTDASRIYLSEFEEIDNKNNIYYDTNFFTNQRVLNHENQVILETVLEKDYLNNNEINIKNIETKNFNITSGILPTILLKSNNIRLVARKAYENSFEDKKLEEGSIRLVKESNDYLTYSHLAMESNGDVAIDANTLYLGNFQKELVKQNKQNEDTSIEDLVEMHGKGSTVLIGYDPVISEPLVLGETLKNMIAELIDLNLLLAEEVKILAENLEMHQHLGIPFTGVSQGPVNPLPYNGYHSIAYPDLKSKLENIKNNLNHILSRIAKTS